MFDKKTIFITGGTGSFGKAFIKKILKNYNPLRIVIFSRDEFKQHLMMKDPFFNKHQDKIRYLIGDVRDKERLKLAFQMEIDILIHAAALKQVETSEYNPFETVKTNVLGAQNLIELAIQKKIKKIIALSTDKAASPANLYGATKLVSDKLFVNANNYGSISKFSVVRYGNVFNSRGSVVEVFRSMKEKNVFNVTDKKMTRFNITLDHSIEFVINSLKNMFGGEIFVPKIPSYKLIDLVKAISSTGKIKIMGIRPGEKLHEEMVTSSDSLNCYELDNQFVILPLSFKFLKWNIKDFLNKYKTSKPKKCEEGFSYNSLENKNFLRIEEIQKLLKKY